MVGKEGQNCHFFTPCLFATYSTTPPPFDALYEPNGSIPIIDVISEAEDGRLGVMHGPQTWHQRGWIGGAIALQYGSKST